MKAGEGKKAQGKEQSGGVGGGGGEYGAAGAAVKKKPTTKAERRALQVCCVAYIYPLPVIRSNMTICCLQEAQRKAKEERLAAQGKGTSKQTATSTSTPGGGMYTACNVVKTKAPLPL